MSKARQLADLGNVYSDGALSNRNAIINGNFDVWQRGVSGTSGYIADRWRTLTTGSTAAISRQAFTLGQTDVPNEPEYFHRVVATSVAGAGNLVVMQQRVEFARTFAGQTVTLSFWAKADAAKNIAVEFSRDFGIGGSAFEPAIGVTTVALTTAWQKFTVIHAIPSLAGKTIGSQSSLDLTFWFDAGSDYNSRANSIGQQSGTFDIAQVQLEVGDTATPFERQLFGDELARCQRYYCKTFFNVRSHATGATQFYENAVYWPQQMRANPTVTLNTAGITNATAQVSNPDIYGGRAELTSLGAGSAYLLRGLVTADAEL
jgi:hypothetical protein